MLFIFFQPLIIFSACFLPAIIRKITTQPYQPGDHSTGGSLCHPQSCFCIGITTMPPGTCFCSHHIRHWPSFHDCISYFSLLCTIPDSCSASSSLVISCDPVGKIAHLL